MLDFAADMYAFWSPEQLPGRFEGDDPDGAMNRLVGSDR
jgi:hypothetical protein